VHLYRQRRREKEGYPLHKTVETVELWSTMVATEMKTLNPTVF
jgi:hypothetical protein